MDSKELKEVLNLHRMWLSDASTGKRADLTGANLSEANLSEANLSEADLIGADLTGANLFRADLSEANLYGAKFTTELFDANDLSRIKYDQHHFPLLALNLKFLCSVQTEEPVG
jgi:uncharacterized protein YjbI with pentapeptide repeats